MNIIVLIKQVPDTTDVKIDPQKGTLIREGIPSIINPDDVHAIEEALRLREQFGGETTAISMGPPQAIEEKIGAIAMGIDKGILLTDEAFAGADTWATSYTLGKCIEKIGIYDLILCGHQAIDGDTAQVGPQVAEFLNISQITYVRNIQINDGKVIAERDIDEEYEKVESDMPVLMTLVKEINKPRYAQINRMLFACGTNADLQHWNAGDIGAMADKTGLKGSPTIVKQIFTPKHERKSETISGNKETIAKTLVEKLKGKNIL